MAVGDTFRAGQATLSGSAEQLKTIAPELMGGATGAIKSMSTNAAAIYIGEDNTVSATTGWELVPGESYGIDILNLGKIWIIGTAGEKICWSTLS
jgi:hypothetical protein